MTSHDKKPIPEEFRRIVLLGDSLTDGHIYPLMVGQALREAGYAQPLFINAGIGGDSAAGMHARLERDVLPHHPTLVVFNSGTNDAGQGVTTEAYAAEVTAIAARLRQQGIPMLLFTTCIIDPLGDERDARSETYSTFLRQFAAAQGYRLADIRPLLQQARAAGANVMDADNIHPNFEGHRLIARALLDALGFTEVPVPQSFSYDELPGLVKHWRLRAVPAGEPAPDTQTLPTVTPDDSWTNYTLPEPEPTTGNWWLEQERQRGFALTLEKYVGPAAGYLGIATVTTEQAKTACLNVGAQLQAVWLNGEQVYHNDGLWRGWHAGRERVPIHLNAGENTLLIATGNQFFLSITD